MANLDSLLSAIVAAADGHTALRSLGKGRGYQLHLWRGDRDWLFTAGSIEEVILTAAEALAALPVPAISPRWQAKLRRVAAAAERRAG